MLKLLMYYSTCLFKSLILHLFYVTLFIGIFHHNASTRPSNEALLESNLNSTITLCGFSLLYLLRVRSKRALTK
jgi:hypothetical protein